MRPALIAIASLAPTLPPQADAPDVRRIWGEAPHSAFTDLIRFGGRWLCTFREGEGHVSPDGAIRVIASPDGEAWEPWARITSDEADLRDPKLCETPDGRLMLIAAAARNDPGPDGVRHQTVAWFSRDGRDWDGPTPIGDRGVWLWRVTWHEGVPYAVGYGTGGERFVRLYRGVDGRADRFEVLVDRLDVGGYPNEATLRFLPDGSALCLLRRDGEGDDASALLGRAEAPYTDWSWTDLGVRIGGPDLLRLPDGRHVAGVRLLDGGPRTSICRLDPDTGSLAELVPLPSGGDTSYPGLAWHDGLLWASYYSSHEGRSMIYLARVALPGIDAY